MDNRQRPEMILEQPEHPSGAQKWRCPTCGRSWYSPGHPLHPSGPAGNRLFRTAHAIGTQNYICLSTGWTSPAYAPQASLFNDENKQVLTHFLSANPVEANTLRPAWQDPHDTSTIWTNPVPDASYTPDPTAIAWLLLRVVGTAEGPAGGDRMSITTYIQRINTTGGLKPTGSCTEDAKAFVPYTADYVFYKAGRK